MTLDKTPKRKGRLAAIDLTEFHELTEEERLEKCKELLRMLAPKSDRQRNS